MENLPWYIPTLFFVATIYTLVVVAKSVQFNKRVLLILLAWITLNGLLAFLDFYNNTSSLPPRLFLAIAPAFAFIVFLFVSSKGRSFLNSMDVKMLTLVHLVRLPVEIVLLWLFLNGAVPQVMTFEGNNFDIIAGLTAPIAYLLWKKQQMRKLLLLWNILCLCLLFNIVITAILAAPFPLQQIAFDQPNIAVLYFPYVWLPTFIVPIVMLSHITTIRHLLVHRPYQRAYA